MSHAIGRQDLGPVEYGNLIPAYRRSPGAILYNLENGDVQISGKAFPTHEDDTRLNG